MEITLTIPDEKIQEILKALQGISPQINQPPKDTVLLTRAQVAARLGITHPTLRSWWRNGKIKAHRIGNRIYFKEPDVLAALQQIQVLKQK